MSLVDEIQAYTPYNSQEKADKAVILEYLRTQDNLFSRENKIAHMTASAWVINPSKNRILMVHHNLYNSWSWMGGHADGDRNLLKVAHKEVLEESGLKDLRPLSEEIFSLETLTVDGHERRGRYVPSHLHLNITYLFEADDTQSVCAKLDENSAVAWFSLKEGVEASSEPWFRDRIYSKLNQKLSHLFFQPIGCTKEI